MQFIYQQQKMIDVQQTKIYQAHVQYGSTIPAAEGMKFQTITS